MLCLQDKHLRNTMESFQMNYDFNPLLSFISFPFAIYNSLSNFTLYFSKTLHLDWRPPQQFVFLCVLVPFPLSLLFLILYTLFIMSMPPQIQTQYFRSTRKKIIKSLKSVHQHYVTACGNYLKKRKNIVTNSIIFLWQYGRDPRAYCENCKRG